MNESDAITLLKRGDIRGLEILVRNYQLEAVRIAFPITNDLGLAEEAVQDAFLQVYNHIDQFDESRPFRAWFLRIVVNNALKTVKREKRLVALDPLFDLSSKPKELAGREGYEGLNIEQAEFGNAYDDREILKAILQDLSPDHRAVLELKYYLDMTDDEIAEIVQVPAGTVKSRLHAAKRIFRSLLNHLAALPF